MPNTDTDTNRPPLRAVYIGTFNEPRRHSLGHALEAPGFDDRNSADHLAWMFNPDGDGTCYYMEENDLSFEPEEITIREHVAAHMPNTKLGDYVGFEPCPDSSKNILFTECSFSVSATGQLLKRKREDHIRSLQQRGWSV
jgi:hypothetical protein